MVVDAALDRAMSRRCCRVVNVTTDETLDTLDVVVPLSQSAGQMPRIPSSPPVNSPHWNTRLHRSCAKASVSIAK